MENVEDFYDQLSSQYSDLIKKCVPRYDELLHTMFLYLEPNFNPLRILDLGCGTGNLTQRILEQFSDAQIDVLDISAEILEESRQRFVNKSTINYLQADFKSMILTEGKYDLVMSSIAIHHVEDPFKLRLYKEVYQSLKKGGIFIFADQTRGITDEIYFKNIECWKKEAQKLGSTEENWNMWMAHQDAHDFHSPVSWHLENLKKAGFNEIDLLSKYLMWGVFWAKKN